MRVFSIVALIFFYSALLSGCISPLHQAILDKDTNQAITLLRNGADVNETNPAGNSALGMAALEGDLRLVTYLVRKGANVNHVGKYKATPLLEAIQYRVRGGSEYEIAKILIQYGADVNYVGEDGQTALSVAMDYQNQGVADMKRVVQLLIDKGADVSYVKRFYNRVAEKQQRDKEESRAFWKGAATLATGVAVGNASRGLSSDQQTRMMKSSMQAVDSGDASGFTDTTRQIKSEQAQSHKTRMIQIETEKERNRAAQRNIERSAMPSQSNRSNSSYADSGETKTHLNSQRPVQSYRCEFQGKFYGNSSISEDKARADALYFYNRDHREGGMGNIKKVRNAVVTCKFENKYSCIAVATYEQDSSTPCGSRTEPGSGSSK